MKQLFDLEKIKSQIKEFEENPIGYRIGVFYSEKESSYCLVRYHKFDDSVNIILLCKTIVGISNKNSFKEEVTNLAKYFNAEIIEDLPQFAQRLQEQMNANSMLFLDSEIFGGIGADGGAHTQKIYGIKTQGCTAFDAASANQIEKANISDLVDACATQAKIALHTVDTVWMHPKMVNKLRRTKDSTGQYIVNMLITGELVMGGLKVVESIAIGVNELLVAEARILQLWIKRNMTLKVGQFGTDIEVDRYTAILFTRAQCLVEDEDKKGVIYVSDVAAAVAAIDSGA